MGDKDSVLGFKALGLDVFPAETVDEAARVVTLLGIRSGYTAAELAAADDPYADKAVHRAFVAAQARCT